MPAQQQHHHRSSLSQSNKPFKRRHATKGSLKAAAKGRTESTSDGPSGRITSHRSNPFSSASSAAGSAPNSANARRNLAKQIQANKRRALKEGNRVFGSSAAAAAANAAGLGAAELAGSGLGKNISARGGAPRTIAVLELADDVDAWKAIAALEDEGDEGGITPVKGRSTAEAQDKGLPFVELDLTRHRTTLQLHPLLYGALYPMLDAVKAADFVLLLLSSTSSIEPGSWGELALRVLQSQGLSNVLCCVPTLGNPIGAGGSKKAGAVLKASNEAKKSLLSFAKYFAPEVEKVHALDDVPERRALLRSLATTTPRRVAWRDFRSSLFGEEAKWSAEGEDGKGTLRVKGWIRGAPISAQRLVHIPDFGDFKVKSILAAPSTASARPNKRNGTAAATNDVEMDAAEGAEEVLDERDDEAADDLQSEAEVDEMDQEQTWPTDKEMDEAPVNAEGSGADQEGIPDADLGTTPRTVVKERQGKKVGFQATWLDEDDDMEEDDEGDEEEEAAEEEDGEYDEEAEMEAYREMLEADKERRKAEADDAAFPDEVDTPMHIPARVRFARYRGLKSFRTSPWDPYEDLPRDYARIFQFDEFGKTRRRVEGASLVDGVPPGNRVELVIEDVPREAAQRAGAPLQGEEAVKRKLPFVVFGLLRHEHKMSVINFTVTRNTEYDGPVKSKDPLLLCLGPRRFRINPIFSQHDLGSTSNRHGMNNVHKFERYLRSGVTSSSVASCFAPITFGGSNVPAVLLRERSEMGEQGYDQRGVSASQMPILVGAGRMIDAGPTRINAKRIVLSGHPFKVHKRTATIRFMFFNPDDVHYFSPLELHTKLGRTGHIKESLGTHGYFKAHFDKELSQVDTVLLPLYKRVYPKWTTQLHRAGQQELPLSLVSGSSSTSNGNVQEVDEVEMEV